MEKTLVLIKPDGVERKLMGQIISIYENKNLNIIKMKMMKASRELAEKHYEELKEKPFFEEVISYITEERLCVLVVEGENAVELIRKLNGNKDILKAEIGSIRGKYGYEKTRTLVHASDSVEHAKREIAIWFS